MSDRRRPPRGERRRRLEAAGLSLSTLAQLLGELEPSGEAGATMLHLDRQDILFHAACRTRVESPQDAAIALSAALHALGVIESCELSASEAARRLHQVRAPLARIAVWLTVKWGATPMRSVWKADEEDLVFPAAAAEGASGA